MSLQPVRSIAAACVLCLPGCGGLASAPPASAQVAPASAPSSTRVVLTFDDLPAHGPLPDGTTRLDVIGSIAATLARHHVPPTYGFTNGSKLEGHPEDGAVLEAWVRAGNLLGNHGLSHLNLDADTKLDAYLADIDADEATLRAFSPAGTPERSWKVYRYPYLQEGTSPAARRAVREHLSARGYRVAEVSIDFGDWAWNGPYARCAANHDERAIAALDKSFVQESTTFLRWATAAGKQAFGRDVPQVVLMHVGAEDARALDAMLTAYEKAGVTFVSLDEALDDPAYARDTGYFGQWGEGFFEQLQDGARTVTLPHPAMPLALLGAMCEG